MIAARDTAAFASAVEANFECTVIVLRGALKSTFVVPRNSVNEYAPNAAPSATAATSVSVFAGREKVADAFPASARDAAPAARRRVSCGYCDDLFPRPVKTNNRT